MTPVVTWPVEPFEESKPVAPTGSEHLSFRYAPSRQVISYRLFLPKPVPPELRVSLEIGQEGTGVWARILELDLTAEGASFQEALGNLINSALAWLEYLRDDRPDLDDRLAAQERYVRLLDAAPVLWFKSAKVL